MKLLFNAFSKLLTADRLLEGFILLLGVVTGGFNKGLFCVADILFAVVAVLLLLLLDVVVVLSSKLKPKSFKLVCVLTGIELA